MKLIKDVEQFKNDIIIEFTSGYLQIGNTPADEKKYKGLNLFFEPNKFDNYNFKQYPFFSKKELVNYQIIILSAYFFQSDKLDEGKKNENSIESIKNELELLVQIRMHLRSISEYIDSYEELLGELICY